MSAEKASASTCARTRVGPRGLIGRRREHLGRLLLTPVAVRRDRAKFSASSADRLNALEDLADDASRAIRTLRGMLEDEDPLVAHKARRLLRELDVRGSEE